MKRRDFIKDSAAAGASTLGFNIKTYAGSPNGVVRVAVVGVNGQARRTSAHIPGWPTSRSPPSAMWTAPCSSSDAARLKRTRARRPQVRGHSQAARRQDD